MHDLSIFRVSNHYSQAGKQLDLFFVLVWIDFLTSAVSPGLYNFITVSLACITVFCSRFSFVCLTEFLHSSLNKYYNQLLLESEYLYSSSIKSLGQKKIGPVRP